MNEVEMKVIVPKIIEQKKYVEIPILDMEKIKSDVSELLKQCVKDIVNSDSVKTQIRETIQEVLKACTKELVIHDVKVKTIHKTIEEPVFEEKKYTKWVEEIVTYPKHVPVDQPYDRFVPQDVPYEKPVAVEVEFEKPVYKEKIYEIPKIKEIEKIIEVPKVSYRNETLPKYVLREHVVHVDKLVGDVAAAIEKQLGRIA